MADNRTKPTAASVETYLAAIGDAQRRKDCDVIAKLMSKATQAQPTMWGPAIVGFGSYHYKYDSGHEGDSCITGFASRKNDISVYLVASAPDQDALLARLGKHKMGKACLTIRKLADVDVKVLEKLIVGSVAEVKRRYC